MDSFRENRRAPNGWYASVSYAYGIGGACSPISVWNDTAYTTRQESLEAGIRELKRGYQILFDSHRWAPDTQKANAARMIALLDHYLIQSRQLSLF